LALSVLPSFLSFLSLLVGTGVCSSPFSTLYISSAVSW
jgi:hypothetical protein